MTAREKHEWRALAPLAKEINIRLEKADIRDGEAQDHRLAAALKLAEAKKMCDERKLKFAPWCEANVDHSPTQLQALLKIGRSSDPVLAIADFRTKTNKQNQQSRKRQLAKATIDGVVDKTPQEVIEVAMAARSDEERYGVVCQYAGELGWTLMHPSETEITEKPAKDDLDIPDFLRKVAT